MMASVCGHCGAACVICPTCLWVGLKPLCLCVGQAVDRTVLEDEGGHLSLPSLPAFPGMLAPSCPQTGCGGCPLSLGEGCVFGVVLPPSTVVVFNLYI